MSGERPLTTEEEAMYREGLRNAPTSGIHTDWSLVDITTAEWADRCRRLLATLDAARTAPEPGERLRARIEALRNQAQRQGTWGIEYGDDRFMADVLEIIEAAAPEPTAERLRDIEREARDFIELHDAEDGVDPTWPCTGQCIQARSLRAALARPADETGSER